jgi:protein TonB
MKKIIFSLAILFFTVLLFSQATNVSDSGKVFTTIDQPPLFPGGEDALKKFLDSNIKYPTDARQKGIEGIVYVSFVVSNEGKVFDARVLKGSDKSLNEEALRVVNSMPTWKPGIKNGVPISVRYDIPVRFSLSIQEEKKSKKKK